MQKKCKDSFINNNNFGNHSNSCGRWCFVMWSLKLKRFCKKQIFRLFYYFLLLSKNKIHQCMIFVLHFRTCREILIKYICNIRQAKKNIILQLSPANRERNRNITLNITTMKLLPLMKVISKLSFFLYF